MISKLSTLAYRYSQTNLQLLLNKFAQTKTPHFKVQSSQIEIVKDPMDFYLHLYKLTSACSRRIGLSSLYLGTGTLQRYLLDNILKALHQRPTLNVRLLFDYYRSKRVQKGESGIEMVDHAIGFAPNRIKAGYLTENRSPLLKLFSKGLAEVVGVHHIKLYVFDDTTLITGANLSHSYFTRRQDRCIMVRDCQPLSSYFYDLISTLVEGSYLQLQPQKKIYSKKEDLAQYYKLWRFGNRKAGKEEETSEQQQMQFDPKDLEKEKKPVEKKEAKDIELRRSIAEARQDIRKRYNLQQQRLEGVHDDRQIHKNLNQLSLLNQQTKEIVPMGEAVYLFPTVLL